MELFAQRGQAVSPSFVVTGDNAPIVAEICRRLDGVPLAIELAAARVTHLSLPTLRDRLQRRLPLLTGGGRDRPLRLQTMRDAIAWSYDLLGGEEQALFRHLAVFAGGCTLEATEWVMGDGSWVVGRRQDGKSASRQDEQAPDPHHPSPITHHPSPITLDVIAALVDASLLRSEPDPEGATRYWMLETIREYALECLAARGEETAARQRHAAYYLAFAARLELAELLPDTDRPLALLEAEHANLRAALAWLEEVAAGGEFAQLAAAAGRFWSGQGHYHEGRGWLERAVAHPGAAAADRAKALVALGIIETYQGAGRDAEPRLSQGLAGCREQGDAFHAANALLGLGALAIEQGDLDRGTAHLEEALGAAAAVPDQRLAGIMLGWALTNLAVVDRTQGNHALAAERLEEALRLERGAGYRRGMIMALRDLGDLVRDRGDYSRALACYREALDLGRDSPRTRVVSDVIESVGIVAAATGQADRGARLLGAAEALRDRIGLRFRVRENQVALDQAVAATRSALGEPAWAAAWAAGRNLTPAEAADAALEPLSLHTGAPGASLTPREVEIVRLLALGLTDPAIAAALFISVRTVEHHVARIFAKLGVRTRTAAASAAIARGLIEPTLPTPA